LSIPTAFIENLNITGHHGEVDIPVTVDWRAAAIVTPDEITLPVSIGAGAALEPGGHLVLNAVIRPRQGIFRLGGAPLTLDIERAAKTLLSPSGGSWDGRYPGKDDITIRIVEVRTAGDLRRKRMHEAATASAHDDDAGALRLYLDIVRDNPSDNDARLGIGSLCISADSGRRSPNSKQCCRCAPGIPPFLRGWPIVTWPSGTTGRRRWS
jgi:hypothetical protein